MTKETFDKLRLELSIKSKNGLEFTLAAGIIWLLIAFLWSKHYDAHSKSILTFIIGSIMLPLAFLFSKLFKTTWAIKNNPLQPLGLWLNFAQLFYFPFLIFTLLKMPGYFIMVYAIITGAHIFPYSWFYKTSLHAIFAGIIVIVVLFLGFNLQAQNMYLLPLFVGVSFIALTGLLYLNSRHKQKYAHQTNLP
jgi:hypothetical protein